MHGASASAVACEAIDAGIIIGGIERPHLRLRLCLGIEASVRQVLAQRSLQLQDQDQAMRERRGQRGEGMSEERGQ